jgi:hypothetical protein
MQFPMKEKYFSLRKQWMTLKTLKTAIQLPKAMKKYQLRLE